MLVLVALLLGQAPGLGRPDAARAADPSGAAAPTADLANFKLVQSEDFASSLALGQWPGPYAGRSGTYGEWPDTAGQWGVNSGYSAPRVVSVRDGMLDYPLHTENGRSLAAAVLPVAADHLYGRVSVRLRSDPVPGYKTAFLYWPQSGVWPRDGEIDFPEGNLTGTVEGYVHHQGATQGNDQAWVGTAARYPDWHIYTLEWTPGRVDFLLDGARQGRTTDRVPNTKMCFVLQAERCLDGCAAPADAASHLQIDWVAVWDYAPGTPGGTTAAPVTPTPTAAAAVAPGALTLSQPVTLDRAAVAPGGTLGATATYRNDGGQPLTVNFAALALRGPNGERAGFSPAQGATTVAAGATLTLRGTATLPPARRPAPGGRSPPGRGPTGSGTRAPRPPSR